MTELLTAARMRAIEEAAIRSGAATGLELMERAGRGVVDAFVARRPEMAAAPARALVVCGPGNNGGDGFVVARLLAWRGWSVEVRLFGDEAALPPDAAANCRRWREIGGVGAFPPEAAARAAAAEAAGRAGAVVVDALFGTGLGRPLGGALAAFAEGLGEGLGERLAGGEGGRAATVVAIDLPSGICSDSGRVLGAAVIADLTVSFHRMKCGHHLGDGPAHCGEVAVADIGLGDAAPPGAGRVVLTGEPRDLAALTKSPRRGEGAGAHKYSHGHALVLSGGVGRGGAARLAARGALRIGAGLVTVGAPPAALIENAAQLNAIMLAPVPDAEALRREMEGRRITAVCAGPGLGHGERTRSLVSAILGSGLGAVLDGDALSEYRDDPGTLFAELHDGCILTPHEGEFGRLFRDILERLKAPAAKGPAFSKADATREAAKRAGCVVLFKGPDTVIADPSGRCAVNPACYDRAAPWLATAGSGDVLAGFAAGLLARGFEAMAAAGTAAWLHVDCARRFGPGLIAEDLPDQLPPLLRELGL